MKVACIQTTSTSDIADNIAMIAPMVREAASKGAQFIALPENAFYMRGGQGEEPPERYTMENHPGLLAAKSWAAELGVWLLAGSLGITAKAEEKRRLNRSVLIDGKGNVAAYYDKIHLFDVEVGDGQTYLESSRILPGGKAVIADTPWGKTGLTICYDLRFPHLFRAMAKAGASLITVPAAFTQVTGEAHWHVLLRARAIENGCFILAPAQTGTHPGGRQTFGHSLIIDPWGRVLADAGKEPGIIMAELDMAQVEKVRKSLPSLKHDREFTS